MILQQMPPRSRNPEKKKGKKPTVKKATAKLQDLPRLKILPRELMPSVGTKSLKASIDSHLPNFYNAQEVLPSLSLLASENQILQSPLKSFTVSGEANTFFLNIVGEFADISGFKDLSLFVKKVHLIEPIPFMQGEYALPKDGALPQPAEGWQRTLAKIHDPYNEAYIDALCSATLSRLVELDKSPHWCRFYGTFNARADKHVYNITDEISSLKYERWFQKNKKAGVFTIRTVGEDHDVKPLVEIVEEGGAIECVDLESISGSIKSDVSECIEDDEPSTDDESSSVKSLAEPPVRISKLEDEDDSSVSDDGSDIQNECEYFSEFTNFPVQVTFHERCDGTMDALLDTEESTTDPLLIETKDQRWSAWIYQVIAALTVAQYYYGFVHNDLHTNNIMWCGTGETHLYYKLTGPSGTKYYKVPTYGRIMKVIDFGRASFWLKDREKLFITDSYADGNDASGQYNCEPYYDETEERVNPNASFDLCRLAVSIFDALYNEAPEPKKPMKTLSVEPDRVTFETTSEFYNLLWQWLTDDEGMNILRNPDDSERFPDFDLYKHIARHSKNCVPREQAQIPYFDTQYKIEKHHIPKDATIWEIPLQ